MQKKGLVSLAKISAYSILEILKIKNITDTVDCSYDMARRMTQEFAPQRAYMDINRICRTKYISVPDILQNLSAAKNPAHMIHKVLHKRILHVAQGNSLPPNAKPPAIGVQFHPAEPD